MGATVQVVKGVTASQLQPVSYSDLRAREASAKARYMPMDKQADAMDSVGSAVDSAMSEVDRANKGRLDALKERVANRLVTPMSRDDMESRAAEVRSNAKKWRMAKIHNAGIPSIFQAATFETNEKGIPFEVDESNIEAWQYMHKIANEFVPGMRGCVLFGIAGAGKTAIACVTAKRLIHRAALAKAKYECAKIKWYEDCKMGRIPANTPEPVKPFLPSIGVISWSEWANQMAAATALRKFSGDGISREQLIAQISGPTLLVVDDIGKNEGLREDQARSYMFTLVNTRYEGRRKYGYVTIYTTNLSHETLAARYNDPGDKAIDEGPDAYGADGTRLNGATTSRIMHDCDYLSVGTSDRRIAGRDS